MADGLIVLGIIASIALVWALCTALAGAFVGAVPTRLVLFAGPNVRVGLVRGVELRLGLLPIGSSVQFLDVQQVQEAYAFRMVDEDTNEEVLDPERVEAEALVWAADYIGLRRLYETLPLAARVTILLVGWVPTFLFAQVVLGLQAAGTEIVEGWSQIFRYLFDEAYASGAIAWLKAALAGGRVAEVAATIAMKMVALNLLPLPLLAGGQIILEILRSATRRPLRWPDRLAGLSFAVYLMAAYVFVDRTWRLLRG